MNLAEYATQKSREKEEREIERARKGLPSKWDDIRKQCSQKGYFSFGPRSGDFLPPFVKIGVHGYPDVNDQMGYMHRHNYFEMIYVYRGNFVNVFPDKKIRMQQGEIMLLNPNVLHAPYVEQKTDQVFNIFISNSMVREKIIPLQKDNTLLLSFFMDVLYRGNEDKRFLYFTNNSPFSIQLMESMLKECIDQRPLYQNIVDTYLILLLTYLTRDYCNHHSISPLGESKDSLCYEIISYIGQNCDHVTLKSLAEHFQYTPNYLSRLIRQKTGKTFIQLVTKHKLQRAEEFLNSTNMSITDIASATGFRDVPHFIRCFKKEFDLTPSQYRKKQSNP